MVCPRSSASKKNLVASPGVATKFFFKLLKAGANESQEQGQGSLGVKLSVQIFTSANPDRESGVGETDSWDLFAAESHSCIKAF